MNHLRRSLAAAAICVTIVTAAEAVQTSAAKVQPITHVYQAYQGASGKDGIGVDREFRGYASPSTDLITSVPGLLRIDPGHKDLNGNGVLEPSNEMWRNYVLAAQVGVPYAIKNVTLQKKAPEQEQCSEVYFGTSVIQHGTPNLRLWWSLLYEAPGTTWTLTIFYATYKLWDDDGDGPNIPSYVHCEVWKWELDVSLSSLKSTLEVFHELPFGMSQAPLISDERLYATLVDLVNQIETAVEAGDILTGGLLLEEFELLVADRCIGLPPSAPRVGGFGTGIAQTNENPTCCKLLVDAGYLGRRYGLFQASR